MVLLITFTVFFATVAGCLGIFWWMEARRETLPERFRQVVSAKEEGERTAVGRIRKWAADARKRISWKSPRQEDLVEYLSGKEASPVRLLLNRAGFRAAAAIKIYWGVRIGLPVLLATFAFAYGKGTGLQNRGIFLLAILGFIAGVLAPDLFLKMKIRKRQEIITDSLPDALDLLVVCVEAGLGLNASFVKITEEFRISSPVLSDEFEIVNREMVAGKPRMDALRALGERTGVEEVKSLVAMLIQTEKLGTSLAQSLRVHSDSLRTRRRQRAEEAAAKTTIKLVFPLVLMLFPALFIVILGPGVIAILRTLAPIASQ